MGKILGGGKILPVCFRIKSRNKLRKRACEIYLEKIISYDIICIDYNGVLSIKYTITSIKLCQENYDWK
jgi:hypothetical protein